MAMLSPLGRDDIEDRRAVTWLTGGRSTGRSRSVLAVLGVGDVISPAGFRPLVAGNALGDRQVAHEVAGSCTVPVPLVGRGIDDVARADLRDVTTSGLDESAAIGDVERLPKSVRVPRGAGRR